MEPKKIGIIALIVNYSILFLICLVGYFGFRSLMEKLEEVRQENISIRKSINNQDLDISTSMERIKKLEDYIDDSSNGSRKMKKEHEKLIEFVSEIADYLSKTTEFKSSCNANNNKKKKNKKNKNKKEKNFGSSNSKFFDDDDD